MIVVVILLVALLVALLVVLLAQNSGSNIRILKPGAEGEWKATCHNCGCSWMTTSTATMMRCPSCGRIDVDYHYYYDQRSTKYGKTDDRVSS